MIPSVAFAAELGYFLSAVLFIAGLRRMTSPTDARPGIWWAGLGMLVAVGVTFSQPQVLDKAVLIISAMAIGGVAALVQAKLVSTSQMPRMVAIYNSLGGGAAAGIAAVELLRAAEHTASVRALAIAGGLIGCVAFAGSFMAWAKLGNIMAARKLMANRQVAYVALMALVLIVGLILATSNTAHPILLLVFFILALLFGMMMTLPIAVADIPVLISLFNALTGLAVAFEGYVLGNPTMMIAGTLVCAAGVLLTRLMARSVNRRLSEIMYSGFGVSTDTQRHADTSHVNDIDAYDAAISMAFASKVVVVPGYGMAVAQAQHKLRELTQLLEERGVDTRFAIHPVAGRMPGHMNVLLAEAGVPYEKIVDLAEINSEFDQVDIVLVVGANDIVNPSAKDDTDSPLYGMPVMDVAKAGSVIVLKRGDGRGYADVPNRLLLDAKTRVLFGDARTSAQDLISAIKSLD
ncbi:MAG: NAD(P)(+) transhydrogenase (Re/Si-specific) subunit beta [Gammaproteobacteria bacterium]|nr:NAD(P)(+) transhydrogenase (Re/Si-specific) subunit beta [Gammaproteobacteria bacterium]